MFHLIVLHVVQTGCREIRKGLESLRLELGNLKQTLKDAEGEVMI